MNTDQTNTPKLARRAAFADTRWTVVLATRHEGPGKEEALAELCRGYWSPLFAYARCSGLDRHDAEDAVQGFFAHLLGRGDFAMATPERGKFRSFLLTALKNFLIDEHRWRSAAKRGGGVTPISIDADDFEAECQAAMSCEDTPETAYARSWANAALKQALAILREEYALSGKLTMFAALQPYLTAPPSGTTYSEIGRNIGLSEGSVGVAVHRLRRRFGDVLRVEVGKTVETEAELEEELRYLINTLTN